MICVNICNAAAPRGTPRHMYAGTSCPAPKKRTYENVPAFLKIPASAPLTVKFANFCPANCDENSVLREATCGNTETGQSERREAANVSGELHAYHGLDALEVDNEIRIAVVDDGAHASVDDCLEVRE